MAADAAPPYVEHRPITYLSARDLGRLLDATTDDDLGPLYAVARTCGLRRGELLGLTWADLTDGRLTVQGLPCGASVVHPTGAPFHVR